jgi:hypothetical protein
MDWQVLEWLVALVLLLLAVGLHRLIRWFGKTYAMDVFQATPEVGRSFVVLADIAYYLIFAAYILSNIRFQLPEKWTATVSPLQIESSVSRIAGICALIGVLHGINVFVLPFIGGILAFRVKLLEPRKEGTGGPRIL